MNLSIIILSQMNHALAVAYVNATQLAELGFHPLDNKAICGNLPPEQTRQLRNAKLYPADSVPRIRHDLAARLAQPFATSPEFERKPTDDTEGGDFD